MTDQPRVVFDIDGTICHGSEDGNYEAAEPDHDMIHWVRMHRCAGYHITLWSARGAMTGKDWRALTERQLEQWGVPYDVLRLDKPYADIYVDDRAVHAGDFLNMATAYRDAVLEMAGADE